MFVQIDPIQFKMKWLCRLCLFVGLLAAGATSAQVQTEMRVFNDSFISPYFEATQKTHYQFIGAQLKSNPYSDESLKMNISGAVALGSPLMNYLNISEFYFEVKQSANDTFFMGRKRMLWSELDARWDLGVWEPVFEWNPLSPDRQGLTGFFYQVDRPWFNAVLYASPIFIPNQGPSFDIKDGEFAKGNPWFPRPPESIRLWQEATNIEYQYEAPDEMKIVLQNSYGLKVTVGDPQFFRTQLSYAYKPSNQLSIGYDGRLVNDENLPDIVGRVQLQPEVLYHSLMGLDMTLKLNRLKFGLSGLYDKPSREEIFESAWTHSVYEDAVLLSPYVEWSNGVWGVSFQHLQISGGNAREVGEFADPNRAPLFVRYPYQEAQQISFVGNFELAKDRRWISKLSYMHSNKNSFDLIRFSTRLKLSALWSLFGEAQLLSAGETNAENQNEIFQYVNNDRLMLGVAYAF